MDSRLRSKIKSLDIFLGMLGGFRNQNQITSQLANGLWVSAIPVIDNLTNKELARELEIKIKELMAYIKENRPVSEISEKSFRLKSVLYRISGLE